MGIFQDWVSVGSEVAVWTDVQVKSLATCPGRGCEGDVLTVKYAVEARVHAKCRVEWVISEETWNA